MVQGMEPKQFDFSVLVARYVVPVLERKILVLAVFLPIFFLFALLSSMVNPEYVSEIVLRIDEPFIRASNRISNQDSYQATRYAAQEIISEARRIQSPAFCANVFSRLPENAKEDLKTPLDLSSQIISGMRNLFSMNGGRKRSKIPKEYIIMEMAQRLTITTDNEARLISIRTKAVNKDVGPIILEHMAEIFLEMNAQENKASIRGETHFVESEKAKAYQKYLDAENQIVELRKDYGIPAEVEITRDIELQLEMRRREFNLDMAKKRYFTVEQLLTETQMREAGMLGNIKIISPASTPLEPSKTAGRKILGTGFFLGLALALGVVFILEFVQAPLRHELDVENVMRIPVMGVIPKI